jgi:hypothetical protein
LGDGEAPVVLRRGEWAALVIEMILLAGVAMAAVMAVGRRLTELPATLWFTLGILAAGVVLLPFNLIVVRQTADTVSLKRLLLSTLAGAVAGGVVHYFFSLVS